MNDVGTRLRFDRLEYHRRQTHLARVIVLDLEGFPAGFCVENNFHDAFGKWHGSNERQRFEELASV